MNLSARGQSLLNYHAVLTRALPLGGARQLGEGQTAEELAVEAAFAQAIRPILTSLYSYPLREGVEEVPDLTLEALIIWLLTQYESAEDLREELSTTLEDNFARGFNVGGVLALGALGLSGSFNLTDEEWLGRIAESSRAFSAVGGDMSLVDTTASELARRLTAGRALGLESDELAADLLSFIVGRSLTRSSLISATETVRWSRRGIGVTFSRNDVEYMIYRTDPSASASGPCPICEPYEGRRLRASNGRAWVDLIPQHVGCVCYYEPDLSEWLVPDDIWLGGG